MILNLRHLIYLSSRYITDEPLRFSYNTIYTYLYCAAITGTKKINCKILSGDFIFSDKRKSSMARETHSVGILFYYNIILCISFSIRVYKNAFIV